MTIGQRKDGKTELLFYGYQQRGIGFNPPRLMKRVVLTRRQWGQLVAKMRANDADRP